MDRLNKKLIPLENIQRLNYLFKAEKDPTQSVRRRELLNRTILRTIEEYDKKNEFFNACEAALCLKTLDLIEEDEDLEDTISKIIEAQFKKWSEIPASYESGVKMMNLFIRKVGNYESFERTILILTKRKVPDKYWEDRCTILAREYKSGIASTDTVLFLVGQLLNDKAYPFALNMLELIEDPVNKFLIKKKINEQILKKKIKAEENSV